MMLHSIGKENIIYEPKVKGQQRLSVCMWNIFITEIIQYDKTKKWEMQSIWDAITLWKKIISCKMNVSLQLLEVNTLRVIVLLDNLENINLTD